LRWLVSVKFIGVPGGAPLLLVAVSDSATGFAFAARAYAWGASGVAPRDEGSALDSHLALSAAALHTMGHAMRVAADLLRLCGRECDGPTAAPPLGSALGDVEGTRTLWREVRRSLPVELGGSGARAREAAAVSASDERWACDGGGGDGGRASVAAAAHAAVGASEDPFPAPAGAPVPPMPFFRGHEAARATPLLLAAQALPAEEPAQGSDCAAVQRLLDDAVASFNVTAQRPRGGGGGGAPRAARVGWLQSPDGRATRIGQGGCATLNAFNQAMAE
jgi:hypothetical protein